MSLKAVPKWQHSILIYMPMKAAHTSIVLSKLSGFSYKKDASSRGQWLEQSAMT